MSYDFISIRGTNGAGKSTLVRKLISDCINVEAHYIEGRKNPAYYTAGFQVNDFTIRKIGILGHYEGEAGGGCDNLKTTDQYYELTHKLLDQHGVSLVVGEGMIFSKEFSRIQKLKNPVMLFLNIPVEECFKGVQQRRIAKGGASVGRNEEKLKNTIEGNLKGVESSCRRLADKGYLLLEVTKRDDAWPSLVKLISGE